MTETGYGAQAARYDHGNMPRIAGLPTVLAAALLATGCAADPPRRAADTVLAKPLASLRTSLARAMPDGRLASLRLLDKRPLLLDLRRAVHNLPRTLGLDRQPLPMPYREAGHSATWLERLVRRLPL